MSPIGTVHVGQSQKFHACSMFILVYVDIAFYSVLVTASQRCSAFAHDQFMFHVHAAVCMKCIGGLSTCRRKMLQPAVARIASLSLWRPRAAPAQARAMARVLGCTPQAGEVEPPVGNSGVTPRRTSPGARVLGGRRSQPTVQGHKSRKQRRCGDRNADRWRPRR